MGIPLAIMGYSSEGYGVFRRRIWGIPLLDRGIPYGICYIGSDIEYIKLEDTHSYLDEIFPKLNTTIKLHNNLLYNLCCFVLSWLVLFWGRWVSWVGVLS